MTRFKSLSAIAALALCAAIAMVSGAFASGDGTPQAHAVATTNFTVNLRKAIGNDVDVAPKGPSLGDQFQSNAVVRAADGTKAGTVEMSGVSTTKRGGILIGVLKLASGHVMFQDAVTDVDNNTYAITGGTGSYVGAVGTLTVHVAKGSATADIALEIQ